MNKVTSVILFALIVVAIVAAIVFLTPATQQTPPRQNQTNLTVPPSNQSTKNQTSTGISAAELARHDTQSDCWVGYKGDVYDLTAWLPRHPGSAAAIAPYCGTSSEFEAAFKDQHGTSQVARMKEEAIFKGKLQ